MGRRRYRSPAEIQAEQLAPQRIQQAKTALNQIQIPGCAIVGTPCGDFSINSLSGAQSRRGQVFDNTYPNTLSGVISCDEFTSSIERINIAGKIRGLYVSHLFSILAILSLCFFVVGFVLMSTRDLGEEHVIPPGANFPGMFGFFGFLLLALTYFRYQTRKSGERQWHAISAENEFYTSSERTIPCTWKLQAYRGTAQVMFYGHFKQLELSSGAGFGSSIDVVAASCGFEAIDDLGLPRNLQIGIVVPGAPIVTATTALVSGQGYGYGYGAYGTMEATAPMAVPGPQAHAPAMSTDNMKAPLLPPSYGDSWEDSSASASGPAPILLTKPNYKPIPSATPAPMLTNNSSNPDSSSHSVTIPTATVDSLVCAQCSNQLPRNSIFCSQCGARVGL